MQNSSNPHIGIFPIFFFVHKNMLIVGSCTKMCEQICPEGHQVLNLFLMLLDLLKITFRKIVT